MRPGELFKSATQRGFWVCVTVTRDSSRSSEVLMIKNGKLEIMYTDARGINSCLSNRLLREHDLRVERWKSQER